MSIPDVHTVKHNNKMVMQNITILVLKRYCHDGYILKVYRILYHIENLYRDSPVHLATLGEVRMFQWSWFCLRKLLHAAASLTRNNRFLCGTLLSGGI